MWKGTAECGGTGVRWRRCRGGAGDTGVDGFRVDSEIPLHPPPRSLHLECDRLYHRLDAVRCLLSAAPRAPSQQCLRACVSAHCQWSCSLLKPGYVRVPCLDGSLAQLGVDVCTDKFTQSRQCLAVTCLPRKVR